MRTSRKKENGCFRIRNKKFNNLVTIVISNRENQSTDHVFINNDQNLDKIK